jgi:hypothetical protein
VRAGGLDPDAASTLHAGCREQPARQPIRSRGPQSTCRGLARRHPHRCLPVRQPLLPSQDLLSRRDRVQAKLRAGSNHADHQSIGDVCRRHGAGGAALSPDRTPARSGPGCLRSPALWRKGSRVAHQDPNSRQRRRAAVSDRSAGDGVQDRAGAPYEAGGASRERVRGSGRRGRATAGGRPRPRRGWSR